MVSEFLVLCCWVNNVGAQDEEDEDERKERRENNKLPLLC
jgi:hypothetical protein